jgi:hypothetical protein
MASLDSNFDEIDLNLLFEAVDEWEKQDYAILGFIEAMKKYPFPDDMPDDVKEAMEEIKKYYIGKEKSLKANQEIRRERSTLIKAKIIMQKTDRASEKLFSGESSAEKDK